MRRLLRFFRREREDEIVAGEMREHRAEMIEDLMAGGMSREQANAEARRRFGNTASLGERSRDEWGYTFLTNLSQDVRFAMRSMARRPPFAAVVVLPLALGIGANTAIFSIVHAALIRALPYGEPDRLVHLWEINPTREHGGYEASYPDYLDWRTAQTCFERLGGYNESEVTVSGDQQVDRVTAATADADFFAVLGVRAAMGHTFEPRESQPGAPPVVILSYGYWQRRFHGDRGVVGRPITINLRPQTIVGVLPADFHFAPVGAADLWFPMSPGKDQRTSRFWHWVKVVARLRPGVSTAQAESELRAVGERIAHENGDNHKGSSIIMRPLREEITGDVRPALLVLGGAIAMVLLLACANVASLLLARAATRRREMALRGSLGAGRARLVQQLLTENLLLAVAGGALGVVFARWGIGVLTTALPMTMRDRMPFLNGLGVHWGMLAFTAAVSLGSGVLFGLVPALRLSKIDLHAALESGGRSTSGREHARLRNALLVAEVAISMVLLAGAGLMMKSTARLLEMSPGFAPRRLLTMEMALPFRRYDTAPKLTAIHARIVDAVAGLRGVTGAATTSALPLTAVGNTGTLQVVGRPETSERTTAYIRTIDTSYLRTMGLPLFAGRAFDERDKSGAPEVVVVNQRLARTVFLNEDAVSKQINFMWHKAPLTIVGVVGDENTVSLDTEMRPVVYFPYDQVPKNGWGMVVRAVGTADLVSAIRRTMREIEPDAPVYNVRTMEQVISDAPSTVMRRYPAMLMGAFAAIALLMATIGTYGLVAYGVSQRSHEIGVRIALGARPRDILRLTMGQGVMLTIAGIGVGLVSAALLTRALEKLLFEVKPLDHVTFVIAPVVLLVVAVVASFVPARRALSAARIAL
jgi:putative ABC transport system permease protein